jgi:hypothetical protein
LEVNNLWKNKNEQEILENIRLKIGTFLGQ